jgi:uncharacterized delta-60 repeat protein
MKRMALPLALAGVLALAVASAGAERLPSSFGSSQLDRSFGDGGKVVEPGHLLGIGGPAAAADRKGRIVVASTATGSSIRLARYLPNGRLDRSFGSGGTVTASIGGGVEANAVAVDGRGRIVVGGLIRTERGIGGGFVARFLPDGALDTSFGSGGFASAFSAGSAFNAVAFDHHGRIVAAGFSNAGRSQFAVARFTRDGSLDSGFGSGGTRIVPFRLSSKAYAVTIDARDRIVMAGQRATPAPGGATQFALARLQPNGSFDPSFGVGGRVTGVMGSGPLAGPGLTAGLYAVAIVPTGRIVAAGDAFFHGTKWDFTVLGYKPNGRLDRRFASRGIAHTSFGLRDHAAALALDGAGRITVAGAASNPCGRYTCSSFGIARFSAAGARQRGFGVDGRARTSIGFTSAATSVVPQRRHRVILAGITSDRHVNSTRLALAKYVTRTVHR